MKEAGRIPALGVILAGGRGQRMGGADKGLLDWQGRPLAAWVLDALRPQVEAVALSANRHLDRYAQLGAPVFSDADPAAFDGPLAGLLAAMRFAQDRHDWVWIVPCDAPKLPTDLGTALWQARRDAPAVLPQTPDGRLQPTHALVSVALAPALAEHLRHGGRRGLSDWLVNQGASTLDWSAPLVNFNQPEQLLPAPPR